jgi:hypothetical protein
MPSTDLARSCTAGRRAGTDQGDLVGHRLCWAQLLDARKLCSTVLILTFGFSVSSACCFAVKCKGVLWSALERVLGQ